MANFSGESFDELVDDLWSACKEKDRARDFADPENGLAVLAERRADGVLFRTTTKLWRQQPFGVLYGHEINRRVYEEGTAIIEDVYPRSADVASEMLPQEHIAMKLVPTQIWLADRDIPFLEATA